MSWSGFKKTMNRAGTTLMQKAGAVEKTVDKEFEEEEKRFKTLEANFEKLHTETRGYLDSVLALNAAQRRIAETVCQITSDGAIGHPKAEKYKSVAESLENEEAFELEQNIKATVLDPAGRIIAHFPMINDAIKRRGNKLLDHDATRSRLHKAQSKPLDNPSKLTKAEDEAQAAQAAYENLNHQLTTEIPRLVDSRFQLLDPSFEALVKSQYQYAQESNNKLSSIYDQLLLNSDQDIDQQMEDIMHKIRNLNICGLV